MSEHIKISDIPFRDLAEGHKTDIKVLVAFASDIASLPTIDIVRCEECEHWDDRRKDAWWSKEGACKRTSRLGDATYRNHDDFCSHGERSRG